MSDCLICWKFRIIRKVVKSHTAKVMRMRRHMIQREDVWFEAEIRPNLSLVTEPDREMMKRSSGRISKKNAFGSDSEHG